MLSSLFGIPVGITGSAIGWTICAITAAIKKCRSIIYKKKKKHDKMASLAKSKLKADNFSIYKNLIKSMASHDGFVLINNWLKDYNEMKE